MSFKRTISGLILCAFGASILFIFVMGRLGYFIYQPHTAYVVTTALLLCMLGLWQMWKPAHHLKAWQGGILLLPVVLSFFVTPRPLSSNTALARGFETELPAFQTASASFSAVAAPEKRELFDWVKLLALNPEPKIYEGQKVHVTGFVVHNPALPANHALISRFYIACCAADARPVGLVFSYDPAHFSVPDNTWITLDGTMHEGQIEGDRRSVVQLDSFMQVPVPNDPYVY